MELLTGYGEGAMKLLLNSTPIALWYEIIHEAKIMCSIPLKDDLESYLVFLMERYTKKPEMAKQVMAHQFLEGMKANFFKRQQTLQAVGDQCLLFAGLFPQQANKRLVKISYFVHLGQSAYANISRTHNDIYGLLAGHFVALMDVLQSVRCYAKDCPDLMPLDAYELWTETGSKRALSILKQYTQATPVLIDTKANK